MRLWYTNFPHDILKDFSEENDIVMPDILGKTTRDSWAAEDEAQMRFQQKKFRKWAWEHVKPGTPTSAHETQALRLLRFIETGSFDESK